MINGVHISTRSHAELCSSSKFFYDVIKTASKWRPPESQLENEQAKMGKNNITRDRFRV